MQRIDGRKNNELREISITANYLEVPLSSVLVEFGKTKVVCAASLQESVPRWMNNQAQREKPTGWVTSEYSMTPFASAPPAWETQDRNQFEKDRTSLPATR